MRTHSTDGGVAMLPPETRVDGGAMRRIGVELEFSGMALEEASDVVVAALGGRVDVVSAFEHRVRETRLGDFNVEIDYQFLKQLGREANRSEDDLLHDLLPQELLADMARRIVPIEVVSPPIDMDRLAGLDAVVAGLRDAGARGTRHSPVYAFGLHLNPEMPALDANTIAAYLRSFLCLYEWLVRVSEVDWSRRVTPYINPFPTDYVRHVLASGYAPGLAQLIDDYLAWNADRNRALDMLPLFAHIDEQRVRAAIDDPRIKARPALHYRLANCDIDRPDWRIASAWEHWLEVERLAFDGDRLAEMSAAYSKHLDGFASRTFGDWPAQCEKWLTCGDR